MHARPDPFQRLASQFNCPYAELSTFQAYLASQAGFNPQAQATCPQRAYETDASR